MTLKTFDILGREVATLVNETKEAGKYSVKFDASAKGIHAETNSATAGNRTSGIYFSRLTSGNYSSIKKMILVK